MTPTEARKIIRRTIVVSILTTATVVGLSALLLYCTRPQPIPDTDVVPLGSDFTAPVDIEGARTAVTPALTFQDDADTGFFRSTADTLNITAGGTEQVEIDASGVNIVPNLDLAAGLNVAGSADVTTDLDVAGDANVTGDLTVTGTLSTGSGAFTVDALQVDGAVTHTVGNANIGVSSIVTVAIATDTDGTVWTIPDGQVWLIHQTILHVTTNFDCTGDDCILELGDSSDADAYMDLLDADLQTTGIACSGCDAGWAGHVWQTKAGYYFNGLEQAHVQAPSGSDETIEINLEDSSDSSNPSAGAATLYLHYTRIE